MSQWPPADDYNGDGDGSIHQVKDGRRLCGLPVWIFIVLVLLAMVVITAAVVVPIQLNMKSSIAELSALGQCRVNNPCQNGGENVANDNFCGCICTGGYTGTSCTEKEIPDLACTNYDFNDRNTTSGVIRGVKNVTIGSAIPRLFDKASSYNIDLDPTMLLGVFTTARLSCTLQNALVNFNGKTSPDDTELRRRSGGLITDLRLRRRREKRQIGTETSTRSTATSTSTFASATASASSILTNALNADTVDFGRVAVLYIAQQSNVEEAAAAQQALNDTFKAGIDYGKLQTGDATVLLDERSIILSDGNVVGGGGGVVVSTVTRTLTPAMATATRV